jgi:hypothetical protein
LQPLDDLFQFRPVLLGQVDFRQSQSGRLEVGLLGEGGLPLLFRLGQPALLLI